MFDKVKDFFVENKKATLVVAGIVLVGAGAYGLKKKFFGKNKAEKKEDPKEAPKEETKKEDSKDKFEDPK